MEMQLGKVKYMANKLSVQHKITCDSGNLYILTIIKTGQTEDHNKLLISLFDGNRFIFVGFEATTPRHQAIDGYYTLMHGLDAVTLQPGDTDAESFKDYTPTQLEFLQSADADDMRLYAYDFAN